MFSLSTYSTMEPKLKKIFDEIKYGAVNGRILPFLVDENNGRVGINTASPKYTLDVNGSLWVSGSTYLNDTNVLGGLTVGNGLSVATDGVVSGLLSAGNVLVAGNTNTKSLTVRDGITLTPSGNQVVNKFQANEALIDKAAVGNLMARSFGSISGIFSYLSAGRTLLTGTELLGLTTVKGVLTGGEVSPTSGSTFRKNLVINGNFDIWQRGTSFAAIADGAYSTDRWVYGKAGAVVHTVSRDTSVPAVGTTAVLSNYSVKLAVTTQDASIAAGDVCVIGSRIEGYDYARIAQQAFTISFWVRSGRTGTYCVYMVNSGSDRSYIAEYTISSANTWEKKTINVPASPSAGTWDYTTGVGLDIGFTQSCGSTWATTVGAWQTGNYRGTTNQVNNTQTGDTFYFTQVQVELGSQATPFEFRHYMTELALCQRYYEVGGVTMRHDFATSAAGSNATMGTQQKFSVTKRIVPTTVTITNSARSNIVASSEGSNTWTTDGFHFECTATGSTIPVARYTINTWTVNVEI